MRRLLNWDTLFMDRRQTAILGCMLVIIGMLLSRTLLSIGMLVVILTALLSPSLKEDWRRVAGNGAVWAMVTIFMVYFLGGLWTAGEPYYWERLRIKLPFLGLPLAFVLLPPFSRQQFRFLLTLFWGFILLAALLTSGYYLWHYTHITDAYKVAKVLPTPINHIRFSLMVAFAVLIGGYLVLTAPESPMRKRFIIVTGTTFLILFLHVMAVRSGLVGLYAALLWIGGVYIVQRRRWLTGLAMLVLLVAMPYLAYQWFPSFRHKVAYARYDLKMYRAGHDMEKYSDARRLVSMQVGWMLVKQHPVTGVGLGHMWDSITTRYATHFPQMEQPLIPHNQYLYVWAATGTPGLLAFLLAICWPLLFRRRLCNPLFAGFYIIVLLSFLVEATLEGQIGTAFVTFFVGLFINEPKKTNLVNASRAKLL